MPLINPPNEYDIPEPIKEETNRLVSQEQYQRILEFLNVEHWKCPDCGVTNFGRNKYCANYKCKRPKP